MSNIFLTTTQVVERMLARYKDITGIELSATDLSREEVIKMYPFASAISQTLAKLKAVKNARHPGTSDEYSLEEHLAAKELEPRKGSLPAEGDLKFPCEIDGKAIPVGSVATHTNSGHQYQCKASSVSLGGYVIAVFESILDGQKYNLDKIDEAFTLDSSVDGIEASGVNTTVFTKGRNLETPSEMLARIRKDNRRENTGGNIAAYEELSEEASSSVVSATGIKHARGVSTVDVVITSGTSDIDSAVENGDNVVRIPSVSLLSEVQAYVDKRKPTTDDFLAVAPDEIEFDSTVNYELYDESDESLVEDLIEKAWKKFVYKAKPGSRIYVTDIERVIDAAASTYLKHRRVGDFGGNPYYDIPVDSLLSPRTLTLSNIGAV